VSSTPDQPEDVTPQKVSRRGFLKYVVAGAAVAAVAGSGAYYYLDYLPRSTAKPDTVIIAWNDQILNLHPYLLNRSMPEESPLNAIYDRYMTQDRNLKYGPGIVTSWQWGAGNTTIDLQVRSGVQFHNGDPLTADDVGFSMQTAAQPGMAYSGVWSIISSIDINSSTSLTLNLTHYDPAFPTWFGFLDAFVIPKNYYTKVGQNGFAQNPVGSGPYKFVSYQNGVLKLQAFENYWGGAPPIPNVVFQEVLDPSSRASDIQSGTADFTEQVDVSVYSQLASSSGLTGERPFTTDIANFFVAPYFEPFKDSRVRLALHYAIDKNSLVNNVLLGFGRPLSMPEAPGYLAYDPNFSFPYDAGKAQDLLSAAGYSQSNPLNLNVMTTNGVTTKDYEITQACAQMWKNLGMVNVTIDTITVAQFFTARTNTGTLDALSFYVWSNATGDPENDVGFMLWPNSPFSAWAGMKAAGKTDYTGLMNQALQMFTPIFTETDQTTRIQDAINASEWAVQNGLIIPLYQQAQPLVMKQKLQYNPFPEGYILAQDMSWT
jgi:peptide/nickel transport system substrate-binding protein